MWLHHFPRIEDELRDTRADFASADANNHGLWDFVFEGGMEGLFTSGGLGLGGVQFVRAFFCAAAGHCVLLLLGSSGVFWWLRVKPLEGKHLGGKL